MEQEVRELRGLVEEQSFELDNLKANQRDRARIKTVLNEQTNEQAAKA